MISSACFFNAYTPSSTGQIEILEILHLIFARKTNFSLLYNNFDRLISISMEMWSEGYSQLATEAEN